MVMGSGSVTVEEGSRLDMTCHSLQVPDELAPTRFGAFWS